MKLAVLRNLRQRARSEKGESLVEALVSVLIGGLALLMLAVVMAAASNIVGDNRSNMESYYEQANAFAGTGGESYDGKVSLQTSDGTDVSIIAGGAGGSVDVEYAVGEVSGKPVVSYREKGASAGDGS